ncbi:MAG TPA: LLM class flavin-dependent oxidoreductase [Longimicrobiaceae bacterium]|nr:LLM class flavin-dependent oxidoreductase [Longimicrobiaceae bacterium]
MELGLMFFSTQTRSADRKYQLLLDAARFADREGFSSVWTPERHFDAFGGIFPNPAVTSAALAMITRRLQLRAGSLISPLHHVVRIVEEWSVVDNLSGGRVALSFGSGWNVNDFIFFPDRYETRQLHMYEQIEQVQRLWRGEPVVQRNSYGKEVELSIHPKPLQPVLPTWVTSSGNVETFRSAGRIGANLLTHLIGQDVDALEEKIRAYREARAESGFPADEGVVSLMLHTFVGTDVEEVRETVRQPFREYLRSAVLLETAAARGGGTVSGGRRIGAQELPPEIMDELLDMTFDRYFHTAALMGTPDSCLPLLDRLDRAGVDEIACLIDFGVAEEEVLRGLEHLGALRRMLSVDQGIVAHPS